MQSEIESMQPAMELKKSISETERALKSYGAVLETEWKTDKGEWVFFFISF